MRPQTEHDRERYNTLKGHGPDRIVHWEHWSNPDAATYISGIDYYEPPRSCMLKLDEMYPFVGFSVPHDDTPIPRISVQDNKGHGRWGERYRDYWQQDPLIVAKTGLQKMKEAVKRALQ